MKTIKAIIFCLTERSLQDKDIVWPCVLCQDNNFVLPKEMSSAKTIELSDRSGMDACKTILDCLAEWLLPRQSLIVWPNGSCQDNVIVLPKSYIVLPFLWIVLQPLKWLCKTFKLSFLARLSFLLVFVLSYKYNALPIYMA